MSIPFIHCATNKSPILLLCSSLLQCKCEMLWKNILYYYFIVIWCRGKEGKGNNWLPTPNPSLIINLNPSFSSSLKNRLHRRLNRTENEMLQCCLCTAIGAAHICRVYLGSPTPPPPPPPPRCSLPSPHLPSSPQQCGSGRLPHRCPTGPTTDCSSFRSISPAGRTAWR